jgi:hypothetical protein
MVLLAFKRTTYKLERGHDEARRRRRYAAAAAAAGLGDAAAPLSAVKEVEMLKPNARRSPGYVTNALYFNLRVLALHLVRLVVELREDGGEARVGGRPVRVLGRELERAKRLVAPDLELRDPRREPACAVRARCVRGACAVRARCVRGACAVRARCVRGACARPACDVRPVACERV